VDQPGADTLNEIQVGRGVRLTAVQRNDMQGPLEPTGRPTDLAIEGKGYFQVELPDGSRAFTRDGNFSISDQGVLITNSGYTLVPGVAIPEDATTLSVSASGVVSVSTRTSAEQIEVGQLELARFNNPGGLTALGQNLFGETPASGQPIEGFAGQDGFGRVLPGHLEASNVELVQEMVDMITAMRAYEINSKAVQTSEQMAEVANNLVR
jgi:flagellar basal-body rod protein FlgG